METPSLPPHWDKSLLNVSKDGLLKLLLIKNAAFEHRISNLLIGQLHYGIVSNTIHAHAVLDEIRGMEAGKPSRTSKPEPFRGDVLRGFWKKHFFQANFIAQNCMDEWKLGSKKSGKFSELYFKLAKKYPNPIDFAAQIAHALSVQAFEERARKSKLKGEWIVLAKHNGENYYLTVASHSEGDEVIKRRLVAQCSMQYPMFFPNN